MCGITGFLTDNINSSDEMSSICLKMSKSISHRGPDNSDIWADPRIGISLGHQRLAILDLSENGNQPMHSKSGRYVVSYNGEIYNHQSLRREIEGSSYWEGSSDTETLLAAIETWGIEKALSKLVGMFAFALWDKQRNKLILARDRMGEKPLYYRFNNNSLIFGSELKSLKCFPGFEFKLNIEALSYYFKYSYIPSPHTIYEDTYKLQQGSYITFNAKRDDRGKLTLNSQHEIDTFWSVKDKINSSRHDMFQGSFEEAVAESKKLLSESVKMQMLSDAPLGSFLSGGIDSSLITSIMQANSIKPIKTFSIGFDQKDYDEAIFSKKIANHLGTEHTELYLSEKDIVDTIVKLPTIFDEPFADSSQVPTYLVSSLASKDVKVALSGDGGDELFGGYNRYTLGPKITNLPFILRLIGSKTIKSFSPGQWKSIHHYILSSFTPFKGISNFGDKIHKLSRALEARSEKDLYEILISTWNDVSPISNKLELNNDHFETNSAWLDDITFQQNMMNSDLQHYLHDDILVKIDRTAMSRSLEGRVPLLDHRLVEFSLKLPLSMKINHTGGKIILRNILEDYIPNELFEREKQGFAIPIETLIRGPLKDWSEELLDPLRLQSEGILNSDLIKSKWTEHKSGKRNWQQQLWSVLMFQSWLDSNK